MYLTLFLSGLTYEARVSTYVSPLPYLPLLPPYPQDADLEEEVPPPPVPNGRTEEGRCAFEGLFLPKQPANYRPFMILDAEEAARQMAEDGTYTDGKSQAGEE